MDDFRIIYRILKYLRDAMDFEEFDSEGFTAQRFGTNENRFHALLIRLQESGYIDNLKVVRYTRTPQQIQPPIAPRITLKGLEYLSENSMMKKAADIAKGVLEVIT